MFGRKKPPASPSQQDPQRPAHSLFGGKGQPAVNVDFGLASPSSSTAYQANDEFGASTSPGFEDLPPAPAPADPANPHIIQFQRANRPVEPNPVVSQQGAAAPNSMPVTPVNTPPAFRDEAGSSGFPSSGPTPAAPVPPPQQPATQRPAGQPFPSQQTPVAAQAPPSAPDWQAVEAELNAIEQQQQPPAHPPVNRPSQVAAAQWEPTAQRPAPQEPVFLQQDAFEFDPLPQEETPASTADSFYNWDAPGFESGLDRGFGSADEPVVQTTAPQSPIPAGVSQGYGIPPAASSATPLPQPPLPADWPDLPPAAASPSSSSSAPPPPPAHYPQETDFFTPNQAAQPQPGVQGVTMPHSPVSAHALDEPHWQIPSQDPRATDTPSAIHAPQTDALESCLSPGFEEENAAPSSAPPVTRQPLPLAFEAPPQPETLQLSAGQPPLPNPAAAEETTLTLLPWSEEDDRQVVVAFDDAEAPSAQDLIEPEMPQPLSSEEQALLHQLSNDPANRMDLDLMNADYTVQEAEDLLEQPSDYLAIPPGLEEDAWKPKGPVVESRMEAALSNPMEPVPAGVEPPSGSAIVGLVPPPPPGRSVAADAELPLLQVAQFRLDALTVIDILDLSSLHRLYLVKAGESFALVGQVGGHIELLKQFATNPLADDPVFHAEEEAASAVRRVLHVQVGRWSGLLNVDNNGMLLQRQAADVSWS